jgi:hypothetical protein
MNKMTEPIFSYEGTNFFPTKTRLIDTENNVYLLSMPYQKRGDTNPRHLYIRLGFDREPGDTLLPMLERIDKTDTELVDALIRQYSKQQIQRTLQNLDARIEALTSFWITPTQDSESLLGDYTDLRRRLKMLVRQQQKQQQRQHAGNGSSQQTDWSSVFPPQKKQGQRKKQQQQASQQEFILVKPLPDIKGLLQWYNLKNLKGKGKISVCIYFSKKKETDDYFKTEPAFSFTISFDRNKYARLLDAGGNLTDVFHLIFYVFSRNTGDLKKQQLSNIENILGLMEYIKDLDDRIKLVISKILGLTLKTVSTIRAALQSQRTGEIIKLFGIDDRDIRWYLTYIKDTLYAVFT